MTKKVTVPDIRARKGGPKITMVTAYDFPSAVIADKAGLDIILVGDSVANVVHGMSTTLEIGLDEMIIHARAVHRARPTALFVVDMPWLSFHISPEDGVRNAGRIVQEGGAEAVKLEGGRKRIPVIERIIDAEIPVMGHLGLTPQSVNAMGGFKVQGKMVDAAREMIEDARALAEAGCFSIVIEGVPDVLGELITKEVDVPTIGIGAGPGTDGQVLVYHDLLGIGLGHHAKFVRSYANVAEDSIDALRRFAADVQSGDFPGDAESYHVADEVAAELLEGQISRLITAGALLLAVACGSSSQVPGEVVTISVDGTEIGVLVADTPEERRQGLKMVTDVPDDADGMLFTYATPTTVTYGMLDVVMPLDIWFFGSDGELIGSAEMTPCPAEPCTTYGSPGLVSLVLETPAGVFDFPPGAILSGAPNGDSG